MTKLYKAIDKLDGEMTAFIVRDDGTVCISHWLESDDVEIYIAKQSFMQQGPTKNDMEYAINPVLMAEW